MARKTKADAQITRDQLLDAAEFLFQERGVSRTSLQQIADQAGLTRGAIYWHFKDKGELFCAMVDRVHLPFEAIIEQLQQDASHSPLTRLRQIMLRGLSHIQSDAHTRRVFEIVTQKVELVDEIRTVIDRFQECRHAFLTLIEDEIKAAQQNGDLRADMPARMAAITLHSLIDGMIYNWLLDPTDHDLFETGNHAYEIFEAGLRTQRPG